MDKKITDTGLMFPVNCSDTLKDALLESIRFYRDDGRVEITLHTERILPSQEYSLIGETIKAATSAETRVIVHADNRRINRNELENYLVLIGRQNPEYEVLSHSMFRFDRDTENLCFLANDREEETKLNNLMEGFETVLAGTGLSRMNLRVEFRQAEEESIPDIIVDNLPEPQVKKPEKEKTYARRKPEEYDEIELRDVHDQISDIRFAGEVFAAEITEIKKTKRLIQTLSVYDGTDAIIVKRFEGRV
ncbi:MAG: hypothetical protein IKD69_03310, partial [Solobacterium sp.]|nr:hypothetical protein [Solobacterium sp.]